MAKKLKVAQTDTPTSEQIQKLIDELAFHRKQYYVYDHPIISDVEYDQLYQRFLDIKERHPELVDSVGAKSPDANCQHKHPMLSLRSTRDIIDASSMFAHIESEISCEPKIDGLSLELVYRNGVLTIGSTRGDGFVGEDVTDNVRLIGNIPQYIDDINPIEIYGEVYITRSSFIEINDIRRKLGNGEYSNIRNAASGILRSTETQEFLKFLSFFPYTLYGIKADTQYDCFDWLNDRGFCTLPACRLIAKNVEDIFEYKDHMLENRELLNFRIDGLVFKVNNLALQNTMGMSNTHPYWAVAFKFKADSVTTRINDVSFQVGKSGIVAAVALLDEVTLMSSKIKRASLANKSRIAEKDIRINDTVVIEMANDVIPYISEVIFEDRIGKEIPIVFPTECPSCGETLSENGVHVVCTNVSCPAQVVGRITAAVGRKGFNIKGIGPSIIDTLVDMNLIEDIDDIFWLVTHGKEMFRDKTGWPEKTIERICNQVNSAKEIPLHKFIFALGIPDVSVGTATKLAQHYCTVGLFESSILGNGVDKIPGINKKALININKFFRSDQGCVVTNMIEHGVVVLPDNTRGNTFDVNKVILQSIEDDRHRQNNMSLNIEHGNER